MNPNKKIAVLFANYGPYHLARIRAFCDFVKTKFQVVGMEMSRNDSDYQWKTNIENIDLEIYSILGEIKPNQIGRNTIIQKTVKTLSQVKPDVLVIAGYSQLSMLSALLWSLWYRKPTVLLSESKEDDEPRQWWKEIVKSWLVKRYSSALVAGYPHKKYLTQLGFPENAIFTGYDVVDNNVFHPDNISHISSPLNKPFFLAINRFVKKKNLPLLISAYACYQAQIGESSWDLVLCGDGELRSQLEDLIKQYKLENHIHLTGFLQQDELLPYFAHAKCFIHTSTTEQWGLVVNEAMAAGLPVIVSNRCGCFEDLVLAGVNGFGFDPENQKELTNLMIKMSSAEIDLEAMGKASLQHIEKYSPDYFAHGLNSAIDFVLCQS